VTDALPWPHDDDPLSGWWRRLCREFDEIRPRIATARGTTRPIESVHLRAPVLGPSKVIACAINYPEHVVEMRDVVMPRTGTDSSSWMLRFDIFLKAPSSIVGPGEPIVLPKAVLARGAEVHHESELALVIGTGGSRIPANEAMRHVLGYTIGLDITERGEGDRSRRKSWDTFTPLGPWLVTADEVGDPADLVIHLEVNGQVRQHALASEMVVGVPGIIEYASAIMRLEPGDVILTGAPAGVGPIHEGDILDARIDRVGLLSTTVVRGEASK
jgi:2-keto-4-pentenoate hydratase/2-oxohepta-3-ene-1,7-dioic acid hydratase in catechol pathway